MSTKRSPAPSPMAARNNKRPPSPHVARAAFPSPSDMERWLQKQDKAVEKTCREIKAAAVTGKKASAMAPERPERIEIAELVYAVQSISSHCDCEDIAEKMRELRTERLAELRAEIDSLWRRLLNGAEVVESNALKGQVLTPRAVEDYMKKLRSATDEEVA